MKPKEIKYKKKTIENGNYVQYSGFVEGYKLPIAIIEVSNKMPTKFFLKPVVVRFFLRHEMIMLNYKNLSSAKKKVKKLFEEYIQDLQIKLNKFTTDFD